MKNRTTQPRKRLGRLLLAMLIGFSATAPLAADAKDPGQWQFGAEVYLWGASIGGGTPPGATWTSPSVI